MSRCLRSVSLSVLVLVAACGGSDDAPDAETYLGTDRAALFDRYVAAITDVELVSDAGLALLGTTWQAELARTKPRFLEASTATDAYYALVSLKNSFHDAHATLVPMASWNLTGLPAALVPPSSAVTLPLDTRVEYENGMAVYRVLAGQSIAAGSTLVSIDGVAMADFEHAMLEWYPEHSLEGLREFVAGATAQRSARTMPTPAAGATVHFVATDPSGAPVVADLAWSAAPSTSSESGCAVYRTAEAATDYRDRTVLAAGAHYCVYDGGAPDLRVVRYPSFQYADAPSMTADETSLLAYLHTNDVARVLIDVRENGGGSFEFAPTFFGAFSSSPYSIFTTELYFAPILKADPTRIADVLFLGSANAASARAVLAADPAATYSNPMPGLADLDGAATPYAPASGAPIRAVVLSGPDCVSSCDQFVSIMKDNGIAKLAGMAPASGDSPYRYWASLPFADGETVDLVLTVGVSERPMQNGVVIEGHPPSIDFPVMPTIENRGAYLKAVLGSIAW